MITDHAHTQRGGGGGLPNDHRSCSHTKEGWGGVCQMITTLAHIQEGEGRGEPNHYHRHKLDRVLENSQPPITKTQTNIQLIVTLWQVTNV